MNDTTETVTDSLERALRAKARARAEPHLQGFGGNSFPATVREMSDEDARKGLRHLALSALGPLVEPSKD